MKDQFSAVRQMVESAEEYRDNRSEDREDFIRFYKGDATCVPFEKGRSSVVSHDLRATIKKVLPSIMRIILGNEKTVEYLPIGEGDEAAAEQATDYINHVVLPQSDGYKAIHDAVHDALKLRNGILTWYVDERIEVKTSEHTDLTEDALIQLVADDGVEVLEQAERVEQIEGPDGQPVNFPVYDLRIRRKEQKRRIRLEAVPPEEFLIHERAVNFEEAPLIGRKTTVTRSDLVAMGYDREQVNQLPDRARDDTDDEAFERRHDTSTDLSDEDVPHSMQEIDYYDLYVRIDMDDDGIAELRRLTFGGDVAERYLLENEEVDEAPFADIKSESKPHDWEGVAISDDVCEIQRVKTVLLRQTLDNIYWQNDRQPIFQDGAILNMEAVMEPAFGRPIQVQKGVSVRDAMGYQNVPFVAGNAFAMMEYMDREVSERTGVSDASGGLPPDALQNVTAKATALFEQQGIGQTEEIVKEIARGLKKAFAGLLRLVIKNPDMVAMYRLNDTWVQADPRHWNAGMDATVNIGLGAGTRERDMAMMQIVMNVHRELVQTLGADNPFVKPHNFYNTASKLFEAAGLKSINQYLTKPDPQELEQLKQQQTVNPQQQRFEAELQLEQRRMQLEMQLKQLDMQQKMQLEQTRIAANRDKEAAQRDADLVVQDAHLQRDQIARREQLEADAAKQHMQHEHEREMADIRAFYERELFALKQQMEHERAAAAAAFPPSFEPVQ